MRRHTILEIAWQCGPSYLFSLFLSLSLSPSLLKLHSFESKTGWRSGFAAECKLIFLRKKNIDSHSTESHLPQKGLQWIAFAQLDEPSLVGLAPPSCLVIFMRVTTEHRWSDVRKTAIFRELSECIQFLLTRISFAPQYPLVIVHSSTAGLSFFRLE